jgi:hypothetical protein
LQQKLDHLLSWQWERLVEIEDPCSNLQWIFDRKEVCSFQIRSLTPQQSAGNALAFAVQEVQLEQLNEMRSHGVQLFPAQEKTPA